MSSKHSTHAPTPEDLKLEAGGWMTMIAILFLFPTLFFLCVFFPIWVGWTPRCEYLERILRATPSG